MHWEGGNDTIVNQILQRWSVLVHGQQVLMESNLTLSIVVTPTELNTILRKWLPRRTSLLSRRAGKPWTGRRRKLPRLVVRRRQFLDWHDTNLIITIIILFQSQRNSVAWLPLHMIFNHHGRSLQTRHGLTLSTWLRYSNNATTICRGEIIAIREGK